MTFDIKSILIHLSRDEYQCLIEIKDKLKMSWKELLIYPFHDNMKSKEK